MLKWDPSPEFLAQSGHALLGVVAVLAGFVRWDLVGAIAGAGIIFLYGILKEILWDPITETDNPFFWVGVKDLAFITLGAFIGFLWIII